MNKFNLQLEIAIQAQLLELGLICQDEYDTTMYGLTYTSLVDTSKDH